MAEKLVYLQARMPTISYTQEFLVYIERRKSRNTYKNYKLILRRFVDFLPTEDVTAQAIEQYLQSLLAKGLKAKTANLHLACIKSYVHYLARFYSTDNPATKVSKLLEDLPPRRHLTESEYKRLIFSNPNRAGRLIVLLANTGIRAGELKTLNPDEGGKIAYLVGKGHKQRAIPLNSAARAVVEHPDFLMLKSLSYRSLHSIVQKACRRAGIMPASPHDFRHYFANKMRKCGCSLYSLSKILGHSSTKVTESIYWEWQSEEVISLTDCLMD